MQYASDRGLSGCGCGDWICGVPGEGVGKISKADA